MSLEYFYSPPRLISRDHLIIEGDEFAHLTHVMRKRVDDRIRVVDGQGNIYEAIITDVSRHTARCTITGQVDNVGEPARRVVLGAGLLKNSSRFDVLVEKTTEIGVASIVPLLSARSIPHHAKTERWQKLALAAMKQSGRSVLPSISPPATLDEFLRSQPAGALRLICHETQGLPPIHHIVQARAPVHISICIGPEGGFTEQEISVATAAGFIAVTLGPRRLRTETAAIVAVASVFI